MVGGIGQGHRRAEHDTVTDEIVERQLRRETVEGLLDDGTVLAVVTCRDAEVGLLTTTGDGQVVILVPASLQHFLHPVGIVVPVLKLCPRAVVVDLVDVRRGRGALRGIVVHLLEHHGVVVTVQQVVALRLPAGLNAQRVVHAGSTAGTTLGTDLNDTVGTTRTPDGRSGSILQHLDILDVGGVHGEQRGVGLLVGILEVEVSIGVVEDVSVDDDQWLCGAVDGSDTTQTHRRTGTQVTGVGHDVETCDLSLQGLVGRCKSQTVDLLHVKGLCSYRHLSFRDGQTALVELLPGGDGHLLDLCGILQFDVEACPLADGQEHGLVTHVRHLQFVLGTLDGHGEVTVHIGLGERHVTVVAVDLDDVTHHDRSHVVADSTRNTGLLRRSKNQETEK